jgi:hypothetical protein
MSKDNADLKIIAENMLMDMPLRFLSTMGGGISSNQLAGLVYLLNGNFIRGIMKFLQR